MMTISTIVGRKTCHQGQSMYPVSLSPMNRTCNAPQKVSPWLLVLISVLKKHSLKLDFHLVEVEAVEQLDKKLVELGQKG